MRCWDYMFELLGCVCVCDCCMREQWWALVFSPKRACLAKARLTEAHSCYLSESSFRRPTLFLSEQTSRSGKGNLT